MDKHAQREWLRNRLVTVEHQLSTPGTGDMEEQSREIEDLKMQLARLDDHEHVLSPTDVLKEIKSWMHWTGINATMIRNELHLEMTPSAQASIEKLIREAIRQNVAAALDDERVNRRRRDKAGPMIGLELMR